MKNIFWLISLSPKIELFFSIITVLDKIKYGFKNRAMLEMPKKFGIIVTNSLVCYLIVKVSYAKLLLITKQMFISIKFEVLEEVCYTYGNLAKFRREIRSS